MNKSNVKTENVDLTTDLWVKILEFGFNWPARLNFRRVNLRFRKIIDDCFPDVGVVDIPWYTKSCKRIPVPQQIEFILKKCRKSIIGITYLRMHIDVPADVAQKAEKDRQDNLHIIAAVIMIVLNHQAKRLEEFRIYVDQFELDHWQTELDKCPDRGDQPSSHTDTNKSIKLLNTEPVAKNLMDDKKIKKSTFRKVLGNMRQSLTRDSTSKVDEEPIVVKAPEKVPTKKVQIPKPKQSTVTAGMVIKFLIDRVVARAVNLKKLEIQINCELKKQLPVDLSRLHELTHLHGRRVRWLNVCGPLVDVKFNGGSNVARNVIYHPEHFLSLLGEHGLHIEKLELSNFTRHVIDSNGYEPNFHEHYSIFELPNLKHLVLVDTCIIQFDIRFSPKLVYLTSDTISVKELDFTKLKMDHVQIEGSERNPCPDMTRTVASFTAASSNCLEALTCLFIDIELTLDDFTEMLKKATTCCPQLFEILLRLNPNQVCETITLSELFVNGVSKRLSDINLMLKVKEDDFIDTIVTKAQNQNLGAMITIYGPDSLNPIEMLLKLYNALISVKPSIQKRTGKPFMITIHRPIRIETLNDNQGKIDPLFNLIKETFGIELFN